MLGSLLMILILLNPCHTIQSRKMVIIGGSSQHTRYGQSFEAFNFDTQGSTQGWTRVADMPTGKLFLAATSLNGTVYATGGWDGSSHGFGTSQTVYTFNPISNSWNQSRDMIEKRYSHAVVEMHGKIYAISGATESPALPLKSVEVFNPETNQWSKLENGMSTGRLGFGVGLLSNEIYVVGGFRHNWAVNSVEKMNVSTGVWSPVASMHVSRSGHCVAVVGGRIYAAGGKGEEYWKSVEVYDARSGNWEFVALMNEPRAYGGCIVHGGEVYFVGGQNDATDYLDTVDVYNPVTNAWRIMEQKLSKGRRQFGIAYLY